MRGASDCWWRVPNLSISLRGVPIDCCWLLQASPGCVFGKEWVIDFDRLRGCARMNRPSWWASVCAGQLTPDLRNVYRDLHNLKLKIRNRPFEDLGCPVFGLRSLHGRYVKQSSLGHALRSLYLVAIAEGECGECFRSGEELELPYMRVSFHRRDQRLSRSRL